jgi:hypothetical protein
MMTFRIPNAILVCLSLVICSALRVFYRAFHSHAHIAIKSFFATVDLFPATIGAKRNEMRLN